MEPGLNPDARPGTRVDRDEAGPPSRSGPPALGNILCSRSPFRSLVISWGAITARWLRELLEHLFRRPWSAARFRASLGAVGVPDAVQSSPRRPGRNSGRDRLPRTRTSSGEAPGDFVVLREEDRGAAGPAAVDLADRSPRPARKRNARTRRTRLSPEGNGACVGSFRVRRTRLYYAATPPFVWSAQFSRRRSRLTPPPSFGSIETG